MKKINKFLALILIIPLISINFTGCLDVVEIEDLGIILALGFDNIDDGNYRVSVQFLNIDNKVSNNLIGSEVYTCTGETIFNALSNLNKSLGRKFNYSHIQYMVIGDDLARKGINPVIDFSLRFNQMRPNTPIFISKTSANEILSTKVSTNVISAFSVTDLINTQRRMGYTVITTNRDYISQVNRGSRNVAIGTIGIEKKPSSEKSRNYELIGSAAFKQDKLIGYLSPEETRGYNWVEGNINAGIIVVKDDSGDKISIEINKSASKTKTTINNNKIGIQVSINAKSNVREMPGKLDPYKNTSIMGTLEKREDEAINSEVRQVIYKAQKELKLDIFDFGYNIFRIYPKEWNYLEGKWDEKFCNLNVDIKISSQIEQTGVTSKLTD